ncbi:MAG: hypothetical protein KJO75_23920 [Dactylosporangium sp.]|nr:hypothetical protein [Dactylosporangium sp.]
MGTWFVNQILGALLALVYGGVETLWDLLSVSFLVSPDVAALPQVQAIMNTSLIVVNTCYGLAVVAAGLIVMTHGTVQIRYAVGDLLPRLVVGFIAANFARPLCSGLTDLANGLTQGLTGDSVSASGSFAYMLSVIGAAGRNRGSNAILLLVIGLLLAVLTGMLLCGWYVRLGVLIALVAIAPVGLACHGLPATEGAAKLWWRSMLGCLGVVTIQAFALHSTLSVFSNPQANYPTLGLSLDPLSLANLLIVVCMLWVTIKIPDMMRRFVTASGRSHNPVGLVLRMMAIQTASRMLHLPTSSRRGAKALTAGRATAATRAGGYRPSIDNAVIAYWRPRLPSTPRTAPGAQPAGAGRAAASAPTASGSPPSGATAPGRRPGGGRAPAGGTARTATPPRPKPIIPPGATPATAMPATRPAWQTRTPPVPSGGRRTPPTLPPRHPAPRTATSSPTRRRT